MAVLNDIKEKVLSNEELDFKSKSIITDNYIIKNKLIVNSQRGNLLNELKQSLSECKSFYFSVAFINYSGLQLLLDSIKELEEKDIKGKIITSTYLNFTEPKALEKIRNFRNIDLKVFIADKEKGFHTKAYIFENEDDYKIIIGSSNITQRALKSNVEWNVMIVSKKETEFVKEVLKEYQGLYDSTGFVDDEFLLKYENFISNLRSKEKHNIVQFDDYKIIKPNVMQKKALDNLNRLRNCGEDKGLVIAATGTGKTYMSAFDVMQYKPKKMLFLAHREDILKSAELTYRSLCKNKNIKTGFFTGNIKSKDFDYLFATIQTMEHSLEQFSPTEFDYLIIDEAHHSTSPTYKKVLNYFKPKFTLGMTATPERCDEGNIFDTFDNNVALEVRLNEALENELIVPFHYFGITDIDTVDYENIDISDSRMISKLSKKLMINSRVDFIIEKMNFYGYDGEKQKAIGFCINKEHAEYMAKEFNKRGITSIVLSGDDSVNRRTEYIQKLEDNKDPLRVIFTIDIFNEGVDIPSINQVLMLRPTNSPIVFIQQLGRGLRKYDGKEFLTVLDFIGNHNKVFLIALALKGGRYYDKDSLKVSVATDFSEIPGCSNIQMDRIAKERILEQLTTENFNCLKYLKEEYNEFKSLLGGKIPKRLMDYIKYDGAPDPMKFINYAKTYQGFLRKVEKGYNMLIEEDENFTKVLKQLSDMLPIKRPYEFATIKYLINNEEVDLSSAKKAVLKYIDDCSDESLIHAFKNLNFNYYEDRQISNMVKLIDYNGNKLTRLLSFEKIINNKENKEIFTDLLNYGLTRYEKEFGSKNYGIPFFKLYEQYKRTEVALLVNCKNKQSSFRSGGLVPYGNDYFLFVDLHKEKDIKESINYKDEFISRSEFQWQTPNTTSQSSDVGKNIIYNKDRGIRLHLFVRKYKEIDKKVQPYIYIGKANTIAFEGEKPITVRFKLENKISESLYTEFTKKV